MLGAFEISISKLTTNRVFFDSFLVAPIEIMESLDHFFVYQLAEPSNISLPAYVHVQWHARTTLLARPLLDKDPDPFGQTASRNGRLQAYLRPSNCSW